MPYAKGTGLHQIDVPLSNLSIQYANEQSKMLGSAIASNVNVAKESDVYYVFGKEHFRIPETIRANGAKANEVDYTLSTGSYSLDEHALREIVTDRDMENADTGLRPMEDAMQNVVDRILLQKEQAAANVLFTTTSYSNSHSLTSTISWDKLTSIADPIGDVATATSVIMGNCGRKPNSLVMGYKSYAGLRNNPNILDRIKYSERGVITTDILSAVLDIQNIKVGEAIKVTTAEGAAADTMGYVWDLNAWVGYVEPNARLKSASACYNFVKNGSSTPYSVKKYRDEERSGTWVEVSTFSKIIPTGNSAGYIIKGTNV